MNNANFNNIQHKYKAFRIEYKTSRYLILMTFIFNTPLHIRKMQLK